MGGLVPPEAGRASLAGTVGARRPPTGEEYAGGARAPRLGALLQEGKSMAARLVLFRLVPFLVLLGALGCVPYSTTTSAPTAPVKPIAASPAAPSPGASPASGVSAPRPPD